MDRVQEHADDLFAQGRFDDADLLYRQALAGDPDNVHALAQHAYCTLLANRLHEAKSLLERVLRLEPSHARSLANVASVLWRLDEFVELAEVLPLVSDNASLARPSTTVALLRSFAGRSPYAISGPDSTTIRFLTADPLPMIEVSVNGADPAVFFIDTGGLLHMSDEYASKAGVPLYGRTNEEFAGGVQVPVEHGRADLLTIGDMEVRNVPVSILPSTGPAGARLQAPDGRLTQGAIGTTVLAHFLPTIDYVGGALILRRRTRERRHTHDQGALTTPLWLTGDHYLLALGTVNGVGPLVFLVDTGGAGIGFTAPNDTYAAAGITVPTGPGFEPVTIDSLTLGPTSRSDIVGVTNAFPPALATTFGFRIGGLITHTFFRALTLTLDFDRMQIRMSPS